DGRAVTGWSEVNLQLIRRLGETGSLRLRLLEPGSTVESERNLVLSGWLKGAEDPDPLGSLGIRPWRPQIAPVLAHLDPEGPAQAAGLQLGDRLLSLEGRLLDDWQQVVDVVRERPGQRVAFRVERDGRPFELSLTLAARGEGEARTGYLGAGVEGGEWPA